MNISICKDAYTYVWGQHIPGGAWYGQDDKSWWFCTAHGRNDDGSLILYRFNGTRWSKSAECSKTTLEICAWADKHKLWWTKCHWFKEEDRQKGLVARRDSHIKQYKDMMRHERKHKKGGSGIRLDQENYYASRMVTDYECSSRPLHDFPQF